MVRLQFCDLDWVECRVGRTSTKLMHSLEVLSQFLESGVLFIPLVLGDGESIITTCLYFQLPITCTQ